MDDYIVGDVTTRSDNALEFTWPDGWKASVLGTIPLSLNGNEASIGDRKNGSLACKSNLEWLAALVAAFVFPAERELYLGQVTFLTECRSLLSLLAQSFVNRYGALFLSRSYRSKIASTTSREIGTPLL